MAATRRKPPRAGLGRPNGSKNKLSADVKKMILTALDGAGGAKYLQRQADENPAAFMGLVGKVLPMQVTGEDGKGVVMFGWLPPVE